ncbi:MAG: NUDIX hydrolase [Lachnospiraceae bacterium]|nr:NUDIX hydrolase [Lachnospiraceae bacterium]
MAVYKYDITKEIVYKTIESSLKMPINKAERDKIIKEFSIYKNVNYFNNRVVRLEDIELQGNKIEIKLSLIDFFDFLAINITSVQLEDFVQYLKRNDIYHNVCGEIEQLKQYCKVMMQTRDFETLVHTGISSNALAISVLLTDDNGDYLLTQRSGKTGISEKMYSVTATGAVDEIDYYSSEPLKNCVIRELHEELNVDVNSKNLQICSIVAGENKLQPIVIINGKVEGTFVELLDGMSEAKDFTYEVDKLFIANKETLEIILCKEKFTEAVEYHLRSVIG